MPSKTKNIVCFDTQILIWGVKREATKGQESNIRKAEYLIDFCEEQQLKVLIPSIVTAELLSGTSQEKQSSLSQFLQQNFRIVPFDLQAAQLFARIWQTNQLKRKELSLEGFTRSKMKADCLIVATAVARGSSCIYSLDGPLKRFAQGVIEVRGLPDAPPAQMEMFEEPDN